MLLLVIHVTPTHEPGVYEQDLCRFGGTYGRCEGAAKVRRRIEAVLLRACRDREGTALRQLI